MQYSQRDPNRDHTNGRIYRLVYKDKPLLKPVTQSDKTETELLEQFRAYEWRTRYAARAELRARPEKDVLAAVQKWVATLNPSDKDYDRLRCEALWVQQGFHAVDLALLKKVLAASTPDARAAAVRVAADERDVLPESQALLIAAATDASARVRTEASRGLSYFPTPAASSALLAALRQGSDPWLIYTAEAALAVNQAGWQADYLKGDLTRNDPIAKLILDGIIAQSKTGGQVVPYLQILLGKDPQSVEAKSKAIQALSDMRGGNADNGRVVFRRNCTACHKVYNEGADYGPQMDGKEPVAKRLTKYKIVESIIDPNAEVDKKYLSTAISTVDGKTVTGLLVEETPERVVIFDGKEKRTIKTADIEERKQLKQSSMPEGLAATMSPVEFLDLITFLSHLR